MSNTDFVDVMRKTRLSLHTALHPSHKLIGKSGTSVACGTCLGFSDKQIEWGHVGGTWQVPKPWRVK